MLVFADNPHFDTTAPFGRHALSVAGYSLVIAGLVGTGLWFADNL